MWLPTTEAEQLGVLFGGEEPRLGRDSGKERSARPTAWEHGHDMWIAGVKSCRSADIKIIIPNRSWFCSRNHRRRERRDMGDLRR
jgi:hypothetical protein